MNSIVEKKAWALNGLLMLVLTLAAAAGFATALVNLIRLDGVEGADLFPWLVVLFASILAAVFTIPGFFVNAPNEAKVLTVFGSYTGTVTLGGFWWANPFATKKRISLRLRNFSSEQIKVNDLHGNPIEIAAVVVWQVTDTAKASFDVENFEQFVTVQSETALRALATEYPYDAQDEDRPSLRANPSEVAAVLRTQLQQRLEVAGVTVLEARLTHLAYAQEIAHAMLRRQQARAVIGARQMIVDGAVGMVEGALKALSDRKIVVLDDERKAVMVNNLLVALVSDKDTQPVLNTGSLY
jgi:regulator of protease activity HflC (stomatin/prohibitin superfamily)